MMPKGESTGTKPMGGATGGQGGIGGSKPQMPNMQNNNIQSPMQTQRPQGEMNMFRYPEMNRRQMNFGGQGNQMGGNFQRQPLPMRRSPAQGGPMNYGTGGFGQQNGKPFDVNAQIQPPDQSQGGPYNNWGHPETGMQYPQVMPPNPDAQMQPLDQNVTGQLQQFQGNGYGYMAPNQNFQQAFGRRF